MTEIAFGILADITVAIFLFITIIYCWKLNNRIKILQDSKSELSGLIIKFDESTNRAMSSIDEIHKASKQINDNIKTRLEKANFIADDLAFMIERGTKLADKMEGNISANRKRKPDIGENLIKINAENAANIKLAASRKDIKTPKKRESALDKMLAKRGNRSSVSNLSEAGSKKSHQGVRLKSRSEQDLYDALKN